MKTAKIIGKSTRIFLIIIVVLAVLFFFITLYRRIAFHDEKIIGWGCIALFGALMIASHLLKDYLQPEDEEDEKKENIADMYHEVEEK